MLRRIGADDDHCKRNERQAADDFRDTHDEDIDPAAEVTTPPKMMPRIVADANTPTVIVTWPPTIRQHVAARLSMPSTKPCIAVGI